MVLNKLNSLEKIIRDNGMIYFLNNIDELENCIYELEELRSINTISASKEVYYTLLELLELLQEYDNESMEYDIKQLENKFFDYIGLVKKSLVK
jgi:ribosome biogenesis protein Tsr3